MTIPKQNNYRQFIKIVSSAPLQLNFVIKKNGIFYKTVREIVYYENKRHLKRICLLCAFPSICCLYTFHKHEYMEMLLINQESPSISNVNK